MKHIATVALMLNLGVAGIYAQQKRVKMTFSGTIEPSTINLQPDTNTDEENLAGNGTLGPFTFRELHADTAAPQPSTHLLRRNQGLFSNCGRRRRISLPGRKSLDGHAHGGIVPLHRFRRWVAHLTTTYQITGGTGRFKDASGTLTLTATLLPVLFNGPDSAVLLTGTGEVEGTVSGAAETAGRAALGKDESAILSQFSWRWRRRSPH